jgi:hypothetical protein
MRKTLFESLVRRPFTENLPVPADLEMTPMALELDDRARRQLGRSLSIRLVDAGSCNACELELNALSNPSMIWNASGSALSPHRVMPT